MKLTEANYYSPKANSAFMSASQYKTFARCEAMAMAEINGEYQREKTRALLLGSFVDEMLTGTPQTQIKFIADNYLEIFQKSSPIMKVSDVAGCLSGMSNIFVSQNKPFADIMQAVATIERMSKQPVMMRYLSGEHQVIMTGEIEGVPFKIKMDSYKEGEFIADLKYMASLRSPNLFTPMVEYWGYDVQAAIYQEIVRQNTGKRLPFFLVVATKETPAHLEVGQVNQFNLDMALEKVMHNAPRFQQIKNGEIPPERCEDYGCDYCTTTRTIEEPIDTDLFGQSKKIII